MKLKHSALIGYVILVVLMAVAFYIEGQLANELRQESVVRAYNLCINQNETRNVLTVIMEDARSTLIRRKNDSELTSLESRDIEETLAFYGRAIELLEPKDCPPRPPSVEVETTTPLERP